MLPVVSLKSEERKVPEAGGCHGNIEIHMHTSFTSMCTTISKLGVKKCLRLYFVGGCPMETMKYTVMHTKCYC